jgi:flagellin
MGLDIRTNVSALGVLKDLKSINFNVAKNIEALSSGYRINSPSDDAAGYSLSTKLQSQIKGLNQASQNISLGQSVLSTADGALQQINNVVQTIRGVVVGAANGTVTDFAPINAQINSLLTQIQTIATKTTFNGKNLLDGTTTSFSLQTGANAGDNLEIGSAFASAQVTALGLPAAGTVNFTSAANAQTFLSTNLDQAGTGAIAVLSNRLNLVGNLEQTLDTRLKFVNVTSSNLSSANATIRNADVAKVTAQLSQNQILQQITNAMLTQANNIPALAIRLISG